MSQALVPRHGKAGGEQGSWLPCLSGHSLAGVQRPSPANHRTRLPIVEGCSRPLFTENRAPFNGEDRHELQQYFKWAGIKHKPNAGDPEANGLAKAFM